jgi:peptidoglycan/LPS O-acetylase OafA/YrhL
MLTRLRRYVPVLLVLAIVLVLPVLAFAQGNPTAPVAPPDWTAMGVAAIVLVGGFAVTAGTWLVKLVAPKVPALAWPVVVVVLGQLVGVAQAWAASSHPDPLIGAAASAGASLIYGLWTTAKEQGTAPTTTVPDGE